MRKTYLGDSVYVEEDEELIGITLTTENGLPEDPSNIIFLESQVIEALKRYITRWEKTWERRRNQWYEK